MKLSLLHNNANTSSHIKGNLMAQTRSMAEGSRHAQPIIITQAGYLELSEVELTKFHCIVQKLFYKSRPRKIRYW